MNNNLINYDPMTGQPIDTNNNIDGNIPLQNSDNISAQNLIDSNVENINQPLNQNSVVDPNLNNQIQLQSIPTVDQSKQDFINNTQLLEKEDKEEKKGKINYTFVIILFVIIFVAILFLFPILLKYI